MNHLDINTVAEQLHIRAEQVGALIRGGHLRAVNVALPGKLKARWRISEEALREFLESRQSRPVVKASRTRRKKDAAVIEFF